MQYLLHSSINPDFLSYLIQAGYRFNKISRWVGEFTREQICVRITHLEVIVIHQDTVASWPGLPPMVKRIHKFTDIDKLDFIGWSQLMDLTGAVSFKEVLCQISRKELSSLVATIARRLNWPGPGPDLNEIPTLSRHEVEEVL